MDKRDIAVALSSRLRDLVDFITTNRLYFAGASQVAVDNRKFVSDRLGCINELANELTK